MIGMNFTSFLVLLVIAVVVAVIAHYVIRYRYLEGIDSLFGKIAIGWLGGLRHSRHRRRHRRHSAGGAVFQGDGQGLRSAEGERIVRGKLVSFLTRD